MHCLQSCKNYTMLKCDPQVGIPDRACIFEAILIVLLLRIIKLHLLQLY